MSEPDILEEITVILLTFNNEKTLKKTLSSASKIASEIIVMDNGSTDKTLEILSQYPTVNLFTKNLSNGFGEARNFLIDNAQSDWILSIDSDEVLSSDAIRWLQNQKLSPKRIYSFPFNNYFNEKLIKYCGWSPDFHTRLFNKKHTRFSDDKVHEKVLCKDLETVMLPYPINHYSYQCIGDFLRKMQHYTTLFSQQNESIQKSSLSKAILHGLYAFIKTYFVKLGLLDGKEGFIISMYNSQVAYYKYLKLWETNSKDK